MLLILRSWHPHPFGLGTDFAAEAYRPYLALAHGHLLRFVTTSPSYMGSMLFRAPFALVPIWLGSGSETVCFWASVPGVLAPPLLAIWLTRRDGGRVRANQMLLLLAAINPVTLFCLSFGHPEDVMTACLAIAATVCAGDDRPRAAGLLIAAAVICKPWAAVAVPVVLAVSPSPRRAIPVLLGLTTAFWVPFLFIREFAGGAAAAAGALNAPTGSIFNPADLLWLSGQSPGVKLRGRRFVEVRDRLVSIFLGDDDVVSNRDRLVSGRERAGVGRPGVSDGRAGRSRDIGGLEL